MSNFAPLFPLLVPSFSSKGNLLLESDGNGQIVSEENGQS